jgi:hypothetical protein
MTGIRGVLFFSVLMKRILLVITLLISTIISFSQVAINSSGNPPDGSAMLDVSSTNKGLFIPRLTLANRPSASKTGMLIYQTDGTPGFYYANGSSWVKVGDAALDYWIPAVGSDIRFPNNVALGDFTDAEGYGLNVQNFTAGKAAVRGANYSDTYLYSEGMLGMPDPTSLNLPQFVYNIGVLGVKHNNGSNGAAVYGWNKQNVAGGNYSGLFISDGTGTNTNYGVYSRAGGGATNYAGYYKGRLLIEGHNALSNGADSLNTLVDVQVTHHTNTDTRAINAYSVPQPGYGYGLYATGGYRGVYGFGNGLASSGQTMGVYGYASGTAGARYGVYGYATNPGGSSAVGVYGTSSGATNNWAGYFFGSTYVSSDLRIATTTQATGYALSVNGKIACEEVLIQLNTNWPDYVFCDDYSLLSLPELEKSIKENGHLPGLPSASHVEDNGFEVADMQKRVVEKVEELTLYAISQQKMIDQLMQEVELLKKENKSLMEILSKKN